MEKPQKSNEQANLNTECAPKGNDLTWKELFAISLSATALVMNLLNLVPHNTPSFQPSPETYAPQTGKPAAHLPAWFFKSQD